MIIGVDLRPTDTLFFGSGAPFSADGAQEDVRGVFPPYPATVVGAIRGWLARSRGWIGAGRWPEHLNPILGDGPAALGSLEFSGPFLLRDGEPLFRAPLHLLGVIEEQRGRAPRWSPTMSLRPGDPVCCDLGPEVRLPVPCERAVDSCRGVAKPTSGCWLTREGLGRVLCGRLPESGQVLASAELWREELRVGIRRDRGSRRAIEGQLYSARHVRLGRNIGIGVQVAGIPSEWVESLSFSQDGQPGQRIPLGGESRMASCWRWSGGSGDLLRPLPRLSEEVTLISLTPLDLGGCVTPGRRLLEEHGGVEVVSACVGRPLRIGGWDSLERRSLPLQSVLPAGTVLFCKAGDPLRLQEALDRAGSTLRIGCRKAWGLGLVALGSWTDEGGQVKERP